MTTPKISIIIPIYNAEKYLRRCLDSVLSQSFTEWECLLIDDGSIDNSCEVISEYTNKDHRFRSFYKENGGVGSARNLGLDNAQGEWITFIDSDDYVDDGMLNEFASSVVVSDVILMVAPHYNITKQGYQIYGVKGKRIICRKSKMIFEILKNRGCLEYIVCWSKFFNKDVIKQYNLKFPIEISHSEDFVFFLSYIESLYKSNGALCYLSEPHYYHDGMMENNLSSQHIHYDESYRIALMTTKSIQSLKKTIMNDSLDWMFQKTIKTYINAVKNAPISRLPELFNEEAMTIWKGIKIADNKINTIKPLLICKFVPLFLFTSFMINIFFKLKQKVLRCVQK